MSNCNISQVRERDVSISVVRFIAMLMIIACHFLQYYENELCRWFNVGVQIFFVISGYLYGQKSIEKPLDFLIRGFRKVLVPYWMFLILAIILYTLFAKIHISVVSITKAFFCAGTIEGLGHLWFVGYILFCYLITPYLYWIRKGTDSFSFAKSFGCYFLLFIAIQLIGVIFDSYFQPDRIACYIIGYFIPVLVKKGSSRINRLSFWTIIILSLIFNAARIYFKYYEEGIISQVSLTMLVHYAHMLLGVALFLLMYSIINQVPVYYSRILQWSDKHSYSIYIVHLLFILSPFSLMATTDIMAINWLIVLLSCLSLGYILTECSTWTLNKLQCK